jgi:hypothetical protein
MSKLLRANLFSKKGFSTLKWTIALLFALKVLLFAMAYPLFNTTDELPNFDTVLKQGKGYSYEDRNYYFDTLTLELAHKVQSKEYLLGEFQNEDFVPLLKLQYQDDFEGYFNFFSKTTHQQTHSSPFYFKPLGWIFYALPGDLNPYLKIYSLRFVNVVLAFFLAFCAITLGMRVFQNRALALSCGVLLLGIPQSIYYFINVDILSALSAVVFLLFAVKSYQHFTLKNLLLVALTGALTILIKASGLIIVCCGFLLLLLGRIEVRWKRFFYLPISILLMILLMLPGFINRVSSGVGLFATKEKVKVLGWTAKEVENYFPHVITSIGGMSNFFTKTWQSWWLGESLWEGTDIYSSFSTYYVTIITTLLLLVFAVRSYYLSNYHGLLNNIRRISWFSYIGYFLLFAFLSVRYDFGNCVYPSKAFPIFVSGRLMLGMLFPFLFSFVDSVSGFFRDKKVVFYIVLCFTLFHLGLELIETKDIFYSNKNFFSKVLKISF